ncbi:MAG: sigma-70 family RNA polymerase sigma factor [Planctomycetes bacterium]|nr:sigma-70 family RNA polymerase sigma factor [Planctomycetota bacterium]MBL7044919.1 sigma-70 family RNA polymerase sigma factor [Pirellulaceae bacterium]
MTPKDGSGPSDKELVDSFQRDRNAESLDVLVERYVERTRNLIYGMVLSDSDADDLTQETFLNVMRGLAGFDGRSKFSTWLYQIALNATRRFFRTRRTPDGIGQKEIANKTAPMNEEPQRKALGSELQDRITGSLGALPPPLRAAVVLMVIEGLPAKEVADIEGCSPETVRWRVHEARKLLKQHLAEYLQP